MANVKLSQIAPAGSPPSSTDQVVGVTGGTTDNLYTLAQIFSSVGGQGAALTEVDDTNVTLSLGGTPATALLKATSLTLGWTGTLAAGRLNANVVQGITNDTNVTGTITAQQLTLGWTGVLASARGGTANAFFSVTGPASSVKAFTFPNSSQAVAMLDLANQNVSGGATVTSASLTTGNITFNPGSCPLQFISNNGAYTITAPANDGSGMLLVTNTGSAGATTFSGFSVGANTGDGLTTTNGNKFTISIWRINAVSGYRIAAHQ